MNQRKITPIESIDRNNPATWPDKLTVTQVAHILQMSETGVYKLIENKKLRVERWGRAIRVKKSELLK
jgi:excisionase family DNA binding protein